MNTVDVDSIESSIEETVRKQGISRHIIIELYMYTYKYLQILRSQSRSRTVIQETPHFGIDVIGPLSMSCRQCQSTEYWTAAGIWMETPV